MKHSAVTSIEARNQPSRHNAALVRELVDKAFAGSATELVVRALSSNPVSQEELTQVREFIERMSKEQGK